MEPSSIGSKPSSVRSFFVRLFLLGIFVVLLRFFYVVMVHGESCDAGDFCFFSTPENLNFKGKSAGSDPSFVRHDGSSDPKLRGLWTSREWRKTVHFYSAIFQDLISEGFLSPMSKSLCVGTLSGQDVFALKEIGVPNAIGIAKKSSPPLVIKDNALRQKFGMNSFDFVFSGVGSLERSVNPVEFASEIARNLKPEGYLVVHTFSANDMYSMNSFLDLFNCCRLVRSREIDGIDSSSPSLREIVMKKEIEIHDREEQKTYGDLNNKCRVPAHKLELVLNAEPMISEEPLKPWLTLKRNVKNIKYLTSMADISFKQKYVYIDVGARSYGSSIGSWFKKQYPKQNKTFEIHAIEADRAFHDEYKKRKGVNLLPYAAWVRNESLFFEVNHGANQKREENGSGMGRIKSAMDSTLSAIDRGNVDVIQGFDFAIWLKNTVSEKDFVVMKMDVEGTEFDLIPRLFETGAICLIDEIFLECHYNRWQKCCPGKRSPKYKKTYGQCLDLFTSLRDSGILVHQWW